jgi:hypothetical protein
MADAHKRSQIRFDLDDFLVVCGGCDRSDCRIGRATRARRRFAGIIFSLLIAFVFLDKEQPAQSQNVNFRSDEMQNLRGAARQNALPPQQSVPASSYIPPQPGGWKTNDLTAPGSVTERTTKLLSEDEK